MMTPALTGEATACCTTCGAEFAIVAEPLPPPLDVTKRIAPEALLEQLAVCTADEAAPATRRRPVEPPHDALRSSMSLEETLKLAARQPAPSIIEIEAARMRPSKGRVVAAAVAVALCLGAFVALQEGSGATSSVVGPLRQLVSPAQAQAR